MKLKKFGAFFIVAMLMVSFALSSVSLSAYAETTKKIGIGNLTENDLVTAWYFDEDNGDIVKDYKGNYNGNVNGATRIDTPYGKGMSFDGTDDYIGFDNSIIKSGKKTIRFKIKTTNSGEFSAILNNSGDYSPEKGISFIVYNGYLMFHMSKGTNLDFNTTITSSMLVNDGQWHDILLTWDGTTNDNSIKMYIDNMTKADAMGRLQINQNDLIPSFNMVIGRRAVEGYGHEYDYFKGQLDEIEIYNEVYIPTNAPTNLTATSGDKEVRLSWDKVDNADSYIVKRSTTEGGPYETIAEDITETNYIDTDVENGTTYYYVVCAVIDEEESQNSNEASATPEDNSSGDNALLKITMSNGKINEYDLLMSDVEDFIDWYEDRADDRGKPYYMIEKDYNIGPFESRKDYLSYDKILQFEVMEYNK